jgi:putative membrane protein
MFYDGYHFWGMHLVWWFLWFSFLFWVFATPYPIPFQRSTRDSPFDILRRKLASGEISKEDYQEKKLILERS